MEKELLQTTLTRTPSSSAYALTNGSTTCTGQPRHSGIVCLQEQSSNSTAASIPASDSMASSDSGEGGSMELTFVLASGKTITTMLADPNDEIREVIDRLSFKIHRSSELFQLVGLSEGTLNDNNITANSVINVVFMDWVEWEPDPDDPDKIHDGHLYEIMFNGELVWSGFAGNHGWNSFLEEAGFDLDFVGGYEFPWEEYWNEDCDVLVNGEPVIVHKDFELADQDKVTFLLKAPDTLDIEASKTIEPDS
jgi:hypothetical protein